MYFSPTCSSPPGQAAAPHACDDGHGATAAPWPTSEAQLTGRAWPAAGVLRTWAAADLLVDPVGMERLEETTKDLIRQSGSACIDRLDVILLFMRDGFGRKPTKDWVAQHLMFVWRLAEERVGDGAGRVREAGQVWSSCQGIYSQGMGPGTWRTHKTFTTTFWASES